MRVVDFKDIVYVLENHLETNVAAGIVLELLDYYFEIQPPTTDAIEVGRA